MGQNLSWGWELKITEHPNILPALAREALEEYFEGEVEEVEVEVEGGDAAASYHRWQPWQLRVNFFLYAIVNMNSIYPAKQFSF